MMHRGFENDPVDDLTYCVAYFRLIACTETETTV